MRARTVAGGVAQARRSISHRLGRIAPIQLILLPFVLFVLIPAVVLAENRQELETFDPASFLLLGGTALLVTLGLLAVDRAQVALPTRRYFAGLIEFVLFFVLVTGFLFPASTSTGMRDAEAAPIDLVHVVVALGIAYAMSIAAASTLRQRLYGAVLVFIGINTALTLPVIYGLSERPVTTASDSSNGSIFELSRDKNILVMSFDGLVGSAVLEVISERPDLRARLKDFTFYANAASTSPATSASLATSLYGNRDYKAEYQTVEGLWRSAPENLITNRLARHGWLVSTYGLYGQLLEDRDRAFGALVPRPPPSPFILLNYALARSLTRHSVIGGPVGDRLERFYSEALATVTGSTFDPDLTFSSAHKPDWKEALSSTGADFAAYVEGLRVADTEPVAHFLHFTHTHFPVELDRECDWAGQDEAWFESHQDRSGVKEQTQCALSQLADFADKLKAIGVYDDSLIVLKSDHGKPVPYNDVRSLESFKIRGHPMWGYGRYAPLLAIKDYAASHGVPEIDSHPVVLDDLARTLCVHSGIHVDCSSYSGFDLLGSDMAGIEQSEVTLFIVAPGDVSDFRYDTHESITITRGSDILKSLHTALSAELLRSSVSCTSRIHVESGVALDNGRSDLKSWLTWYDAGSSFLRFKLDEPCASALLILEADTRLPRTVGVRVLARGQAADLQVSSRSVQFTTGASEAAVDVSQAMRMVSGDVTVEVQLLGLDQSQAMPILGIVLDGAMSADPP